MKIEAILFAADVIIIVMKYFFQIIGPALYIA